MLVVKDTAQLPDSVVAFSQGGLTHVSSKMIKYGGDLLLEFSKACGNRFQCDIAEISRSIIENEKLYRLFV